MILDKFSRQLTDLRISVTDRCNFRCSYCMPADIFGHDYVFLAKQEILNFEEIHRVARIFAELGVSKIRLTGGEPLLRSDLEVLIKMLSKINGIDDLALTTNGYFLNEKAKNLREAGLKRITVSLDSLDPETLKQLAGDHLNIDRVLSGIESAGEAGFKPIKINAVVRKGMNENEILSLVRFAKTHGHIIRFIEYMDVGTLNGWKMDDVVSAKEVVDMICSEMPIEPIQKNYPSEVANRYRFLNGEGEFGIIASVTQPFCGDCSRARISADGRIYTCLFASEGFDIKTLLRSGVSDEQLKDTISAIWKRRTDRYSEQRASETERQTEKKVEMYHIGG